MSSCQLPSWEIYSGGQPWTPPNHWPTDAFWLIISSSLDCVLWPHVSQALCGQVSLCESIFALLYWPVTAQPIQEKKKVSKAPGVHSPVETGVEAFFLMIPDQPTGYEVDSTLLSQNNCRYSSSLLHYGTVVCIFSGFRWSSPVSHPSLSLKHNNHLCCLSLFYPFYSMSTAGTWLIKIPFTEGVHTQHAPPFLFSQ